MRLTLSRGVRFRLPVTVKDCSHRSRGDMRADLFESTGAKIASATSVPVASSIAKALNHVESLHSLVRQADKLLAAIEKAQPGIYQAVQREWDEYAELKAFA